MQHQNSLPCVRYVDWAQVIKCRRRLHQFTLWVACAAVNCVIVFQLQQEPTRRSTFVWKFSCNLPSIIISLLFIQSFSQNFKLSLLNGAIVCNEWVTHKLHHFHHCNLEIYLSLTNHPDQLSLAIPLWVGAMNPGQREVMLWLGSKGRYGSGLVADKTVWTLV